MGFLSDKERAQRSPAEGVPHRSLFSYERHAELAKADRFGMLKEEYLRDGPDPSNLRHGYVRRT